MLTTEEMEYLKWCYIAERMSKEDFEGPGSIILFAWWCKDFVVQDMTEKDCECIYNMIVKEFS